MTSKLEVIFNPVKEAATNRRRRYGDEFDGLLFWKPIKKILKKYDSHTGVYKKINRTLTERILNIPEYTVNGKGEKTIIESNHFLIQQVRIPIKYKCTIRKLVQLGLNIGQWNGMPNKQLWKDIEYPTKYKLDKLSTYITKKEITRLSSFITNEDVRDLIAYCEDTTKVVNVKVKHIRPKYDNLKEWMTDPMNVYIGRRGVVFINKRRFPDNDSVWANPFKVGKDGTRDEVVAKYRKYITLRLATDSNLRKKLKQLKGKHLGCWCAPCACHADVLVDLIRKMT